MRISEEQLAAERERARADEAGEWFPTRWWRVIEDGQVVMETSDPDEAKYGVVCDDDGNRHPHKKGAVIQRLFEKHQREWREA